MIDQPLDMIQPNEHVVGCLNDKYWYHMILVIASSLMVILDNLSITGGLAK